MSLISIEGLSLSYGNPGRTILRELNLTIEQGEFVCVVGQTGCGKSTLLRLILGSEKPTSGRILIDGVEHHRPDRTRGYVPQKYALFPDRTVLDNITFGPELSEFGLLGKLRPAYYERRKVLRAKALTYLNRIGLTEADAAKYPDELSGGMQQRVAIAQALMNQPRILLMDEAFSALDPGTRREMQSLIRTLWLETHSTILFVTHNMQEALSLATRIIVLAKDSPDSGARIALDLDRPDPCGEDEMPQLIRDLESRLESTVSGGRVLTVQS